MATITEMEALAASNRIDLAVNALDAVRDLCIEAAGSRCNTLGHVDADHFASLLGLIVDEMRSAQEDIDEYRAARREVMAEG